MREAAAVRPAVIVKAVGEAVSASGASTITETLAVAVLPVVRPESVAVIVTVYVPARVGVKVTVFPLIAAHDAEAV